MNILSYVGMSLQSEVCLWTILGLFRTIFDATLFKMNANLKQVWQMSLPPQLLSLPVQRILRTMISGVMLVQCFTVYVYLASYIVLLYPVFLEERPTLVLPWLLLAAIRKLLCELFSLALGLGTCVLLGPARPSCIKFLISKILTIMPAFYMWTLVFNYYHNLKMATTFKTFPANLPTGNASDCGIELAVRRRRTKSLLGEDQLRRKLMASFYGERPSDIKTSYQKIVQPTAKRSDVSIEDINGPIDNFQPLSVTTNRTMSDIGTYEDWFGSEVVVPRDTDRILEQFVLMLLRIGVYLNKDKEDVGKILDSNSTPVLPNRSNMQCTPISNEDTETPPQVGSSKGRMASYLRDYPNIFMKKASDILPPMHTDKNRESNEGIDEYNYGTRPSESASSIQSTEDISLDTKGYPANIAEVEERNETLMTRSKHTTEIVTGKVGMSGNADVTKLKSDSSESVRSIIERMKNRVNFNQTLSIHSDVSNSSAVSRNTSMRESLKKFKKTKQRKDK